jgi:hypothetical protein
MNTENCSSGWFTDEIMIYNTPSLCSESTTAFLAVSIFCAVARTLLAGPQFVTLRRKLISRHNNRKGSKQHLTENSSVHFGRVAVARVAVEVCAGLFQVLFVGLVSTYLASTRNGLSPVLFGLFVICIVLGQLMDVRVMVKLGKRIIPYSVKSADAANLSQVDSVLKIAACFAVFSIAAAEICFVALAPAFPGLAWPMQAGIALVLAYATSLSFVMAWQLQRCINTVHSMSITKVSRLIKKIRFCKKNTEA